MWSIPLLYTESESVSPAAETQLDPLAAQEQFSLRSPERICGQANRQRFRRARRLGFWAGRGFGTHGYSEPLVRRSNVTATGSTRQGCRGTLRPVGMSGPTGGMTDARGATRGAVVEASMSR